MVIKSFFNSLLLSNPYTEKVLGYVHHVGFQHNIEVCFCCAAQQPETEGGGIPATADEMSELMYKPLPGEWGERSRDEECERVISGIDQLITVGMCLTLIRVSVGSFSYSRLY